MILPSIPYGEGPSGLSTYGVCMGYLKDDGIYSEGIEDPQAKIVCVICVRGETDDDVYYYAMTDEGWCQLDQIVLREPDERNHTPGTYRYVPTEPKWHGLVWVDLIEAFKHIEMQIRQWQS